MYINYSEYSSGYYKIGNKLFVEVNMNLKMDNKNLDVFVILSVSVEKVLQSFKIKKLEEIYQLNDKEVCEFIFSNSNELEEFGLHNKMVLDLNKLESCINEYIFILKLEGDSPYFLKYIDEKNSVLVKKYFEGDENIGNIDDNVVLVEFKLN